MNKPAREGITIRPIQPADNPFIATIIRNALTEFGAAKRGTVFYDASTDALFELFREPGSAYFIALMDDVIVGGAGLFPTKGLDEGIVELVKMYLVKEARGIGLGRMLMEKNISVAKELGYHTLYLETLPELSLAVKSYEKAGFEYLDGPMGDSKHSGCSIWMKKAI